LVGREQAAARRGQACREEGRAAHRHHGSSGAEQVTAWRARVRRGLALGALAALGGAAIAGCRGRPRSSGFGEEPRKGATASAGQGQIAELDLTSGVSESTSGGLLFPLPASRTYARLLRALERATKDE